MLIKTATLDCKMVLMVNTVLTLWYPQSGVETKPGYKMCGTKAVSISQSCCSGSQHLVVVKAKSEAMFFLI